ncbi:MAG: hypothetical protein WC648_05085 [Candidatus Paceibacterota bacterium]|jgi:hypothetical protein
MTGYCQGGDAWRSYVHPATENKGSNWPEETWNLMRDVGSYFLRDRIWRPNHGERSMDDVSFMRLRGFFHGIITVAQWHDTDHPVPLLSAADWQREIGPILNSHAIALGVRWPKAPWNENIDHTDAVTNGPAIFKALLDAGEEGLVVPATAVGSPEEAAYREAMADCYRDPRTAGICLHIREGNLTDVDTFRAKYPDKRLYITEFGFENVPDEAARLRVAREFVLKWIGDSMVAGIAWFTRPCKGGAWAGHYQTPAEQQQWAQLCIQWRQSRLYPAAIVPPVVSPPSEPGTLDKAALREQVSPLFELAKANGERLNQVTGYNAEIKDRAQAIWDGFGLGKV